MGVKALTWAFEQRGLGTTRKMVLLALADRADDEDKCWPGIADIMRRTELDRRTVQRHIRSLEEMGAISIEERPLDGQGNLTNLYHLNVKIQVDVGAAQDREGVALVSSRGGTGPRGGRMYAARGAAQDREGGGSGAARTISRTISRTVIEPEYEDEVVRAAPAAALPYEMESFDATLTGLDGYERDDNLLARLHSAYGERIALDLEAQRIREWALGPKGRGRQVNAPFLHNWLKRELRPVALPPPTNGVAHPKEPALDFMGNPRVPGRKYNEFGEPLSANGKFTTDHI